MCLIVFHQQVSNTHTHTHNEIQIYSSMLLQRLHLPFPYHNQHTHIYIYYIFLRMQIVFCMCIAPLCTLSSNQKRALKKTPFLLFDDRSTPTAHVAPGGLSSSQSLGKYPINNPVTATRVTATHPSTWVADDISKT